MSLRTRLVVATVGLFAVGLILALGATWAALQDARRDTSHEMLVEAAEAIAAAREQSPASTLAAIVGDTGIWPTLAAAGDLPSFIQARGGDGGVVDTLSFAAPNTAPDAAALAGLVEGFRTVAAGDGGRLLVYAAPIEATGEVLLVGATTAASDELIGRVTGVAIVSTLVALVVVAVLTREVVRRGLRPLEDISATAATIETAASGTRLSVPHRTVEIRQLAQVLNRMLAQLETEYDERRRSQDRLRRFVADASHELRTPIATVRGYAELFRRGAAADPDELGRVLARIESEAGRMGELVDEMLLLARLDQGRPLEREPVDLRAVVIEAVAAARTRDPERTWTVAADAPVVVGGDAGRLRQVVDNLLANVVSHTPSTSAAGVEMAVRGDDAELIVRDEGPGLIEADRVRVFDRFFRAAGTGGGARGGSAGSGLGLSIVAAVVESHHGTVRMESTVGEGTSVIVRVPAYRPSTANRARL